MGDGTGKSDRELIWLSSCGDLDLTNSCLSLCFPRSFSSFTLTRTSALSELGSLSYSVSGLLLPAGLTLLQESADKS